MIIIGIDPHKRVHTATAVDAATNRRLASLELDASLPGYRQLARWANGFAEHTWAVENACGLAATSPSGSPRAANTSTTWPRPRPQDCANPHPEAGARTTSSMLRLLPASLHCTATPTLSWLRT